MDRALSYSAVVWLNIIPSCDRTYRSAICLRFSLTEESISGSPSVCSVGLDIFVEFVFVAFWRAWLRIGYIVYVVVLYLTPVLNFA